MELPRALWPWQQSLSIFPRDLAISLGGMIDKLALLIGPLVSPDGAGRNEPDGFDGIGRRGSFERLLTTEWALAEEAPLEFLRRVTTGELSFLEIAHKKPTVARQNVALFDVGPDQRGGPRIVHLAALILLAQRARDGGARFSWGVLQDSSGELMADVNEESVLKLLKVSSTRQVVLDDVVRFCQTLSSDEAEVWCVGGRQTSETVEGVGVFRVEIQDSFDPDAPFDLHVSVTGKRGNPRAVKLELPPGNAAVRLLRDPFQVARGTPQKSSVRIAPDTNIVFSRDYRKLFLRGAEGELITIPVPNSPNSKESIKPRFFRPPDGETLVGVGRLMGTRTIAIATLKSDSVFIHELSPRARTSVRNKQYTLHRMSEPQVVPFSPPWRQVPGVSTNLGTLFQLVANGSFVLHDAEQVLFKIEETAVRAWEFPVAAVHLENGTLSWMLDIEPPTWMHYYSDPPNCVKLPPGTREVRNSLSGFIAARTSASTWEIVDTLGQVVHSRDIPVDCEVLSFGLMKEFLFFVLDSTRTRISCVDGSKTEHCFTTNAPIKTFNAIPRYRLIAFITEEDELCVYSFDHKTLLLRMRLGDA